MPLFGPNVEKLKDRLAIERLVGLLENTDAAVADEAQRALVSLKDSYPHEIVARGAGRLMTALDDDAARGRAIAVLAALGDKWLVSAISEMDERDGAKMVSALGAERAVELLAGVVRNKTASEGKRLWAMGQLGRSDDPRAMDALAEVFVHDRTSSAGLNAGMKLQDVAGPRAISALKVALEGTELTKQTSVLGLLGRLGDDWAVGELITILEDAQAGYDPDRDRQHQRMGITPWGHQTGVNVVHELIGQRYEVSGEWEPGIGEPRVIEALGRVLRDAATPPPVREAIIEGLRNCGDPDAVEALSAAAPPGPVMRCCICGIDLSSSPAMVDHVTNAVFCEQHASLQAELLDESDFSLCMNCGFKYATSRAMFITRPETDCPNCDSSLAGSDVP